MGRTRIRIRIGGTPPPKSSSALEHDSGIHSGVDTSPSSSGGSESPLWSKVWSKPTGNDSEVPLDPEGESKLGTTTGNQLASLPARLNRFHGVTPPRFISFMMSQTALAFPPPPGREGYLAKMAGKQSLEIEHASPPEPQSKGFISNFKTYFGKLGKLKFRCQGSSVRLTLERKYLPTLLSNKHFDFIIFSSTVRNLGESSNTPATSATDGVLRHNAGISLPGLSGYLKNREQPSSRDSANPMDEDC